MECTLLNFQNFLGSKNYFICLSVKAYQNFFYISKKTYKFYRFIAAGDYEYRNFSPFKWDYIRFIKVYRTL